MNEAIQHFVTGGATRKAWLHERTTSQVVANERRNQILPDIK